MADEKTQVKDDMVVSLAYKLTVDGNVLDEAGDNDPIEFLQGHQNIIPGLEKELSGMQKGESKSVVVDPEGGYGTVNDEAFEDVPLEEFPDNVKPEEGMELQMRDKGGQTSYARVVSVDKESAKLDFNHPLAGKDLHFDVKVVELRAATEEEIAHGHVHGDGHNH